MQLHYTTSRSLAENSLMFDSSELLFHPLFKQPAAKQETTHHHPSKSHHLPTPPLSVGICSVSASEPSQMPAPTLQETPRGTPQWLCSQSFCKAFRISATAARCGPCPLSWNCLPESSRPLLALTSSSLFSAVLVHSYHKVCLKINWRRQLPHTQIPRIAPAHQELP